MTSESPTNWKVLSRENYACYLQGYARGVADQIYLLRGHKVTVTPELPPKATSIWLHIQLAAGDHGFGGGYLVHLTQKDIEDNLCETRICDTFATITELVARHVLTQDATRNHPVNAAIANMRRDPVRMGAHLDVYTEEECNDPRCVCRS